MAFRRALSVTILFLFTASLLSSQGLFGKGCTVSETGVLRESADGEYTLIAGGSSRSRKTVHIKEAEGYEEAYSALKGLVGQEIRIEGRKISQKSPWNITVGLIAVAVP